ncbi:toxin-antitoxin system HicB family antitoxin [Streptomyces sp. NPDC006678]|uniref:toxin-antitoxin system HicB family antitoxin n=1 Tax=Streptomyces sp. NPDC006678 TaxID=3157185 RepID=UPI0033DBB118
MAKTQLNVRVDESTAEAARRRAQQRGVSVNRYIEELVKQDAGEVGRTFVEAAADFMKQYESVFAEEFGATGTTGSGPRTGTEARSATHDKPVKQGER